jgi:signal transduction histidine kinase
MGELEASEAARERAGETLERGLEQLAALGHASQAVTASLELDRVLAEILSLACEVTAADYAGVVLVDEAGDIGRSAQNLPGVPALEYRVRKRGFTSRIVRSRQAMIVDEIGEDGTVSPDPGEGAPRSANPFVVQAGVKSVAGLPLIVKGRILGVLYLHSLRTGAFRDQLLLLTVLASQVAIAVENSRLFQAERGQRELAEALAEAAAAVGSTLDLNQVLDRILEQVERVVAGDAFNVMLIGGNVAWKVRWRGYSHLETADPTSPILIPIAKYPSLLKMVQTGKPALIPDTSVDPDWIPLNGQDWRQSYVAVPIEVRDQIVGLLNVEGTHVDQFGPEDSRRLEVFANYAAAAIENARLHRELQDHAQRLEQRVQERTEQLVAQYARLDAILRGVSDGILVVDEGGKILPANPVANTWLTRTLSPEDAACLKQTVQDLAVRAAERPETILEFAGLDLELRAAPIMEAGGEGAAAVVVVHDITHLKALDRMRSRFISNVSHELRTPVTTIKLYAMLARQAPPEKLGEHLEVLMQEADRQARLVEDIVQLSRIDAGRLELELQPTSIDKLVSAVVASHQALAQERGLTLEHPPDEPELLALVDPDRVIQVLVNLLTNAIQFTPERGKVVITTGTESTDDRVWAAVKVTDTGIGIPERELPHVFERFFRGEQAQRMRLSGTGLGLAIAKEIVELHGGGVTVESEVGVGSTFTVWLPLADRTHQQR